MIEMDDTLDTQPVDYPGLRVPFEIDIDEDCMHAKIFSNKPALLKELIFTGTEKDFLCHSKFQFIDAKICIYIYYTDGYPSLINGTSTTSTMAQLTRFRGTIYTPKSLDSTTERQWNSNVMDPVSTEFIIQNTRKWCL